MSSNGFKDTDDIIQIARVNFVYMIFLVLAGIYGYNFLITMFRHGLPLWFTLKCYLALLLWEVGVTLVIVIITALASTFILKQSRRSLRMLFPLCITLIPLSLNLWIYHHRIEVLYICFSYNFRYVIFGMVLVMLFLLFGKIGSYEGLLYYSYDGNTKESHRD